MAIIIPPPPTKAEQNDRVWTDWFVRLQQILSSTSGIAWALVDKTGSALSDIASRNHSELTSVLGPGNYHVTLAEGLVLTDIEADGHQGLTNINGTGDYHISSAEADTVTNLHTRGILSVLSDTADPSTSDIAEDEWAIWKNTTSGEVRLWVNDGGVMKKSAALT